MTRARERDDEEKRFEAREDSYHARVRHAYADVLNAAAERGETAEIDASGSVEDVAERVKRAVAKQFQDAF